MSHGGWEDPYGRPQGWNDPYSDPTPGWGDPYGAQPPPATGPPGYGYGYGYGQGPVQPPASNGSTIAALIVSCVATTMCCNVLAIPAIITAAIAMSRTTSDPASARRLTWWSWGILGVTVVVWLAFIVIVGVLDDDSPSSTY
ncbi:hypothetical protein [Actinomadura hibisca]|uniref:hypothetical protein n=1 Tax=Actinomadura hibisca TaxID=68565 RepID=UPI00082BFB7C|nr:hypothetical protein [Actinomadura hibisca]